MANGNGGRDEILGMHSGFECTCALPPFAHWHLRPINYAPIYAMRLRVVLIGFLATFWVYEPGHAQVQDQLEDTHSMDSSNFGKPNANAPSQLSTFAFLVGKWNCEVTLKQEDGSSSQLQATWEGRYILDGYVIADEYRMVDASGNLLMLGMNYRAYDSEINSWNIKWLEALSGTWLELGPQKLGGVNISDSSIVYKAEFKPGELHRIKFSNINEEHFTWSVDISTDKSQTWNESVMIIQANRFKAAKYK